MAGAMRAERRKERWRRAGRVMTAVAAAVVVFAIARRAWKERHETATHPPPSPAASAMFVRGTPVVERQGARTALSNGLPLVAGDRVVVEPGARTTIALPNGTSIAIEDQTELVLESVGPQIRFDLGRGAVHADVAKLGADERFVIRTVDAEVEVHGTSFDVMRVAPDPSCGDGTSTRVRVREGVVSVRFAGKEAFIHPNEVWPADCGSVIAATPVASVATVEPHATRAGSAPSRPSVPSSTLAAQNDLFEKAIAKKRAGDTAGAIAGFEELLARFPSSHLAQAALGERMKLLREVDRARAKTAARDYLRRYPNGFARNDAAVLLADE